MSNSLAIAAVTATLRNMLDQVINAHPSVDPTSDPELNGTTVTTRPPDKAREGITANQLNIFLYQTVINPAWRNMDMPYQVKPGETAQPPLALNLYYLLTAYGMDNRDQAFFLDHRLLGRAMSILHDHPLLGTDEIDQALAGSGLSHQVERVRITPQPMSLEEISKLWMIFQTQYRLSAAYEVAVVLIESRLPTKAPLPVLRTGSKDQGASVTGDPIPFPTLFSVRLENQKPRPRSGDVATPRDPNVPQPPTTRLNDLLIINGHRLDGIGDQKDNTPSVLFTNLRLGFTREIAPEPGGTATELRVRIPDNDWSNLSNPENMPAGFYSLAVLFRKADGTRMGMTNELSFSLAPQIKTDIPPPDSPFTVTRDPVSDQVTIKLNCRPVVQPQQRVSLLLASREIPAQPHTVPADALTFDAGKFPSGDYFVRLRIDGVDSILVDPAASPPVFDQKQKVTIP